MLKIGTLFSGVGTPELALKSLDIDFHSVFACEKDKFARKTFLANNTTDTFYEDVYDIDGLVYKDIIDILIGGSPCQPFSLSGKRKGVNDTRGELIYEYYRLVEESNPSIFIYENVKGFKSIEKGKTIENFIDSFEKLGYKVHFNIFNTRDYNIPQNRERVYIIGYKSDLNFDFLEKEELNYSLEDFIKREVDEKYYLDIPTSEYIAYENQIRSCAQRGRYNDDGSISQKIEFRKDLVSNTITTVQKDYYIFDGYKRRFRKPTPRECFSLQGFSKDFIFPEDVSEYQLYRQAGNAMSQNILEMIFKSLLASNLIK